MRLASLWSQIVRGVLWLVALLVAGGVLLQRLDTPLAEQIRARIGPTPQTVLPARIEPGAKADVLSEFSARIVEVRFHNGDLVQAGDVLAVLENREITGQMEVARKRVEAALAHIESAKSQQRSNHDVKVREEQLRNALSERELAGGRLRAYSLADAEQEAENAAKRVSEIRPLVKRGLATEAELEAQIGRSQNASRDLEAGREHLSRLRQELDRAESQLRLLRMEPAATPGETNNAEANYADARAALDFTQDRARRLVITASNPGTLLDFDATAGSWITAGTRVARIVDLTTLQLVAPASALIAHSVHVGRPVSIRIPTEPVTEIEAEVSEVSLVPDPLEKAYLIHVRVPNPDPKTMLVGLEGQIAFTHIAFTHVDRP